MRLSQNRFAKDMRRRDLAIRMIEYEARTNTIATWTGLSKYQIRGLFNGYTELGEHARHRGVSPHQTAFFSRSLWIECESAALAMLQWQWGLIPDHAVSRGQAQPPSLGAGERLLAAFDLYRALVPESKISLEYAFLLARELTLGRALSLQSCMQCGGMMVTDRFGPVRVQCAFCRLDLLGNAKTDVMPGKEH